MTISTSALSNSWPSGAVKVSSIVPSAGLAGASSANRAPVVRRARDITGARATRRAAKPALSILRARGGGLGGGGRRVN